MNGDFIGYKIADRIVSKKNSVAPTKTEWFDENSLKINYAITVRYIYLLQEP